MSDCVVVGIQPCLPKRLQEWQWFSAPVPAERLAALRIGTGLVLLLDILATYWPFRYDYFGPGSLAEPDVFGGLFTAPHWTWSLLRSFPSVFTPDVTCLLWTIAAVALTVGVYPRIAAVVAWALAISVNTYDAYLHNSGDLVRQHLLFFLMLTPCGAVWSLGRLRVSTRTYIYPWALRLMFVELIIIYFFNGLYKVTFGNTWQTGAVMHYVLHTPGWSRWSPPFDLPAWFTMAITYFVLAWELTFPIAVLVKPLRFWALLLGASFHVATSFSLEIGPFGLYALCYYLPLLPWERLSPAVRGSESASCVPD